MTEPLILFVKPKAITDHATRKLREAGVIVVAIDDPSSARFVRAGAEISHSALLGAAAKAIAENKPGYSPNVREAFGAAICAAIIAQAKTEEADRQSAARATASEEED